MSTPGTPTIAQIAAEAGVSVPTVSKVLNGRPDVAASTRAHVEEIIAKHGYRPVVTSDLDKKEFPTPSGLFTIASLGGWSRVNTEFFDATNGSITKILNDLGHGASG